MLRYITFLPGQLLKDDLQSISFTVLLFFSPLGCLSRSSYLKMDLLIMEILYLQYEKVEGGSGLEGCVFHFLLF